MMTKNDIRIAYFITPHGYGHAARAASVIAALRARMPALRFDIFTRVPRWFFEESLKTGFEYHSVLTDIGLVQQTTLVENIPETIRRLDAFLPFDDDLVNDLAARLQSRNCAAICCDIAPLGIAVAQAAGIPSVLIENFTWDWIYAGYVDEHAGLQRHIDYLRQQFAAADCHIQAEPVCDPHDAAVTVPPISRPPRTPAGDVRVALDIPQHAPAVLITMGGVSWDYTFFDQLSAMDGVYFVVPGVDNSAPALSNVRLLPSASQFYHPDLTNTSDAVIGKAGYSTVAEVYHAGVPYGYVMRPQFREAPVIEAFIREEMHALAIEPIHFSEGAWLQHLPALLTLPHVRRQRPNGAEDAATHILDLLRER